MIRKAIRTAVTAGKIRSGILPVSALIRKDIPTIARTDTGNEKRNHWRIKAEKLNTDRMTGGSFASNP